MSSSANVSPQLTANMAAFIKVQVVAAFNDHPSAGESKDAFKYWAQNFVHAVVGCLLLLYPFE
jgi:hypothetical protein